MRVPILEQQWVRKFQDVLANVANFKPGRDQSDHLRSFYLCWAIKALLRRIRMFKLDIRMFERGGPHVDDTLLQLTNGKENNKLALLSSFFNKSLRMVKCFSSSLRTAIEPQQSLDVRKARTHTRGRR